MKKVYLLVSGILLAGATTHAQISAEKAYQPIQKLDGTPRVIGLSSDDRDPGDNLACDDFSVAANWDLYTLDGTTPMWEIVTSEPASMDGYIDPMESTTEANGFGSFNGVQYLLDGDVPLQNAVMEYGSSINCSGATAIILEFEQAYRAFNNDRTIVEVTAGDWDVDPVLSIEINTDVPTNGATIQEHVRLDISEIAAGESDVKVRFRWEESSEDDAFGSGYGWYIDDMCVSEAWNYDQEITAGYHRSGLGVYMENGMEYYQIPTSQLTEITFIGKTCNLGGLVQPNAKINVDVAGAGTFSGTSAMVDLPVGACDSLTLTSTFTPAAEGTYDVTYWVDCDMPEEETSNDTILDAFAVTENVYARDNGFSTSSISNVTSNTGLPLLIGNVMDIFGDDQIGAVDIAVSNAATNVGQLIFAQVMILDAGSGAFVYADQTGDHEITAAENGGVIRLIFEDCIDVTDGQTILVLAGHYGGAEEVEFRMAQGVDEQTVLGYTSGASDPFFLTGPSAIISRAVMTCFAGIDSDQGYNFSIGQNQPNPFGDNAVINYELNEAATVSVEFVDVSGKVVKTINNGTQEAGTYTLDIDADEFAEGVYFYTFTVGAEKVTKRMVITK